MRSNNSGARFMSGARVCVPELMRTPSIITIDWSLLAPRMKIESGWPGPPVRPMSMPA